MYLDHIPLTYLLIKSSDWHFMFYFLFILCVFVSLFSFSCLLMDYLNIFLRIPFWFIWSEFSCIVWYHFFGGCFGFYCIFNLSKPFHNSNDTNIKYFILVVHVSKTLYFVGFLFHSLFSFCFSAWVIFIYLFLRSINFPPFICCWVNSTHWDFYLSYCIFQF